MRQRVHKAKLSELMQILSDEREPDTIRVFAEVELRDREKKLEALSRRSRSPLSERSKRRVARAPSL